MSPTITILPIATIQPSFLTVMSEVDSGLIPSEQIWVSCYKVEEESVHSRLNVVLDEKDRSKILIGSGKEDVTVARESANSYRITCKKLGVQNALLSFPVQAYVDPSHATSKPTQPKRITSLALAPDGSQFATGFLDGSIHLFPITEPGTDLSSTQEVDHSKQKAVSRSHKSTVTSLSYFPSSKVLLSGSSDFTSQIHPVTPSDIFSHPSGKIIRVEPARTLTGHTSGITAMGIVREGKKVVTGDGRGRVRVWEVGSAETVTSTLHDGPIVDLVVDSSNEDPDQIVYYAALKNGKVALSSSPPETPLISITPPASLAIIAHSPSLDLLALGTSKGIVSLFSLSSPEEPLLRWRRSESPVSSLSFLPSSSPNSTGRLVITTTDGLPYIASFLLPTSGQQEGSVEVERELVGMDADPIRHVSVLGGSSQDQREVEVWTAGDDGVVRRYIL